jgi:non-ribosomal peptide synthetase component F
VSLPFDHAASVPRPNCLVFALGPEQTAMLRSKPVSDGGLFPTLWTAFHAYLWAWTRQREQIIGTVHASRDRAEVLDVSGCFVHFLPLRATLVEDETVGQLVKRNAEETLRVFEFVSCPLAKIFEAVAPPPKPRGNPLYNVAFELHFAPSSAPTAAAAHDDAVRFSDFSAPQPIPAARVDLLVSANQGERDISLSVFYDEARFDPATIQAFARGYRQVLDFILTHPELPLVELVDRLGAPARTPPTRAGRRAPRPTRG